MPEPFDKPWYEYSIEIRDQHEAMKALLGETAAPGKRSKVWTIANTAELFEIGMSTASENIRLAEALELGIVHQNMSRDEARKIALEYKVKMRFWGAKYPDKNALYVRGDTGIPYIFPVKAIAENFCFANNLEPAPIEITLLRSKDQDKDDS